MIKKRIVMCRVCKKDYKIECIHGEYKELICSCEAPLIIHKRKFNVASIMPTDQALIIEDIPELHHIIKEEQTEPAPTKETFNINSVDRRAFQNRTEYSKWYVALLEYNRVHSAGFKSVYSLLKFLYINKGFSRYKISELLGGVGTEWGVKNVLARFEIRKPPVKPPGKARKKAA